MPYIDDATRERIARGVEPHTAGELSYTLTRTVQRFLGPRPGYISLALVTGVLILTTLEFIRRVVWPYEDRKIAENGDVYER